VAPAGVPELKSVENVPADAVRTAVRETNKQRRNIFLMPGT